MLHLCCRGSNRSESGTLPAVMITTLKPSVSTDQFSDQITVRTREYGQLALPAYSECNVQPHSRYNLSRTSSHARFVIPTTVLLSIQVFWDVTPYLPRFQASAAMLMISALFWDITWRRLVIVYRRFGTTYRAHLQWSKHS